MAPKLLVSHTVSGPKTTSPGMCTSISRLQMDLRKVIKFRPNISGVEKDFSLFVAFSVIMSHISLGVRIFLSFQAFFQRWWAEKIPNIQAIVRKLVDSGQLEFMYEMCFSLFYFALSSYFFPFKNYLWIS